MADQLTTQQRIAVENRGGKLLVSAAAGQSHTVAGVILHLLDQGRACMRAQSLSCVRLFVTPWTVTHQAPLSMGFSRQE